MLGLNHFPFCLPFLLASFLRQVAMKHHPRDRKDCPGIRRGGDGWWRLLVGGSWVGMGSSPFITSFCRPVNITGSIFFGPQMISFPYLTHKIIREILYYRGIKPYLQVYSEQVTLSFFYIKRQKIIIKKAQKKIDDIFKMNKKMHFNPPTL